MVKGLVKAKTPAGVLRYNQSLVIWKFLSRTSRRQVSWLADLWAPQPSQFLSGRVFRVTALFLHTVTRSHRHCTCFPFARLFPNLEN